MKKLLLLASLNLIIVPFSVKALSFAPGTVFLEASTQAECEAKGGDFIEWENEIHCTQAAEAEISAPFSDVSGSHENAQAIDYMKRENIINGYPDGTFQAGRAINRAELTKIVVAFNYDMSEVQACDLTTINLSDVETDAWYAPYICLAKAKNIIRGYDDGTFKPAKNVNLAEASKIMGKAVRPSLSDGNDIWFRPYLQYFSDRNALPTTLSAFDQSMNRGQVSEMLFRVKAKVSNKASLKYGEGNLAAPEVPEEPAPELPPIISCAKCEDGFVAINQTDTDCGQCVPALDCAAFQCPAGTTVTGVTAQSCGQCTPIETSNAEYSELNVDTLQAAMGIKKMALFFHASWCPSCVAADAEIRANIGQFPNNTVVLKADYDKETTLREKFGVTQQHTIVIIDEENKVGAKLVGFTLDQLKDALK